jgi:hypothetical protein
MIKCNFVISLRCTKCCINRVHHLRRETKPGNLNLYKDANIQYLLFEWAPQAGLVVCCYGNTTEQPTKCPDAQWFAIQQCYLEYGIWRGYERHCLPSPIEGKGTLLLNHLELSGLFTTVTQAIAARHRPLLKCKYCWTFWNFLECYLP